MPAPLAPALAVVPPAIFSRMLETALDRSARQRLQNSPCNDGRTGVIVDFMSMTADSLA